MQNLFLVNYTKNLILRGPAFDGERLYKDAVLQIDTQSGKIAGFGERGSIEEATDAKVIVIEDGMILPGLVDAHVHFYSAGQTGPVA